MDPFSISVGAIGITEFALSSISKLRGILDGLDEANDVMQDVAFELEAIRNPLSTLEDLQILLNRHISQQNKIWREPALLKQ
jgi:hypothetical protein